MTRSLMAMAVVLTLSACATYQPAQITAQCPHHCNKLQCTGDIECTCGCKHEEMKGKQCPHHMNH